MTISVRLSPQPALRGVSHVTVVKCDSLLLQRLGSTRLPSTDTRVSVATVVAKCEIDDAFSSTISVTRSELIIFIHTFSFFYN